VAAHVGEMKQVYTLLNQKDICMFACGRKFFCLMDLAAIIALRTTRACATKRRRSPAERNDLTFFGNFKTGGAGANADCLFRAARQFAPLGSGIWRVSA